MDSVGLMELANTISLIAFLLYVYAEGRRDLLKERDRADQIVNRYLEHLEGKAIDDKQV